MNVIECKNCKALNYQTSHTCHNCKVKLYEEINTYGVLEELVERDTSMKVEKQEKLLELYRKYFNVTKHWYETNNSGNIRKETAIEIEKLERELENDNT